MSTPIGNLDDITRRAVELLAAVDVILAEDTRHTAHLLHHLGLSKPMRSLHEHNETRQVGSLLKLLRAGNAVALVSDAGTPLISDPGYRLVVAAREAGLRVIPVPGPCALIAALSVSGLPSDRFHFEGFLPAKEAARRERLGALQGFPHTLVFYESSHRIRESLLGMAAIFGMERPAVVARELTKTFEQIQGGTLAELLDWLDGDANHSKGEFVVLVHGHVPSGDAQLDAQTLRVLRLCMSRLPLAQAVRLAADITGASRNALYQYALEQSESS